MHVARAFSSMRFPGSNQKLMNRRVSWSVFSGYDFSGVSLLLRIFARSKTIPARVLRGSGSASTHHARAMSRASGSVSQPMARCPLDLAQTNVVPDPAMGSRIFKESPFLGRASQTIEGAIRAGNGWTGRILAFLVAEIKYESFFFPLRGTRQLRPLYLPELSLVAGRFRP